MTWSQWSYKAAKKRREQAGIIVNANPPSTGKSFREMRASKEQLMDASELNDHTVAAMKEKFIQEFGTGKEISFFRAPARVNIIGEHTDYNNGYVLPIAIDRSIVAAAVKRDDRMFRMRSLNFPEAVTASLDGLKYDLSKGWGNYPLGVAQVMEKAGIAVCGADIIFNGNIPLGGGLSSSAAIEVLMANILLGLTGTTIEKEQIPVLCKQAENEFIGVQCGIMDQFISALGKANHAIFLDCGTMDYRHIPFRMADRVAVIVGNTKVKRELAHSAYNQRVRECAEAVELLRKQLGRTEINSLSDIDSEEFTSCKKSLPDLLEKRADHVINENARVKEAITALENDDMKTLGALLLQSHASLRDKYEVSCGELDHIVESFMSCDGVYGARMTGAGFGGSAIALVPTEQKDAVIEQSAKEYKRLTGIDGEFYACSIADGAGRM
ncbi:MAG: galactokinase [Chitinispirillaceae bacterium]|nr:galactokinase [Chitinispirillaceae bacterium]